MRPLYLALLPIALLGACAGNLADHIGPKTQIMGPELIRYGLDPAQSECVGQKLAASLDVLQLRRLARSAGAVKQGYTDPSKLMLQDLLWVAKSAEDPKVSQAAEQAVSSCGVGAVQSAAAEPAKADPAKPAETATSTPKLPSAPEGSPTGVMANTPSRPATWLNLGAAPTGQSIAVDASSIETTASRRSAWFRLTNPNAAPSDTSYLLRIDCAGKTLTTMAAQKLGPAGAVGERRDYGAAGEGPLAIETGTVMEIAYLALCT